jgi:hypothetical protein
MFQDVRTSSDTMSSFHTHLAALPNNNNSVALPDISVHVLTTGFWPIQQVENVVVFVVCVCVVVVLLCLCLCLFSCFVFVCFFIVFVLGFVFVSCCCLCLCCCDVM